MRIRRGIITLILTTAAVALLGCESLKEKFRFRSQKQVLEDSVLSPVADVRRDALYRMRRWDSADTELVTLVGLALLGDRDAMVRSQAARTLGAWAHPGAVPYLWTALAGDTGREDQPEAPDTEIKLPQTPDTSKFVRVDCAKALGGFSEPEAVVPLVHSLGLDTDLDVRIECARALRHHRRGEAARGPLIGLADRDLAVRTTSSESLRFMTREDFGPDAEAWGTFLRDSESPLAAYGHEPKVKRSSAAWFDLSQERKAKIREIFSDLFPLERKEGPFD